MTKYIHRNRRKGQASTQITLDDDFNVPDSRPDVMRLIRDRGEIRLEETSVIQGHIRLKGVLRFQLLYRCDGEDHRVDCLEGEMPFQESLAIDGIDEYDIARVRWQMEDLSIGLINSRKLNIRALIQLTAVVEDVYDEEVVTGIEDQEGIQTRIADHSLLRLFEARRDNWRLKEEILLPSNKPNIRQILWKSVQLRSMQTRLMENQISLKGEVLVFVLYLGEEEEERLQWFETALPINGTVECNGVGEEQILHLSYDIANVELESKPDYDGEERMLHLELVMELDIHIYQEDQISLLEDLYSIKCHLKPEYTPAVFERLLIKNESRVRINSRIEVEENQEPILQLTTSDADISVDQMERTPEGLVVEGTFTVRILYVTADDRMPLSSLQAQIPFHHVVEAEGMNENCRYQLEPCLEQLTTVMLDGKQVEIKAVAGFNVIVFEQIQMNRLKSVSEEPLDQKRLMECPGMIGYIGREGDRLWDIAKENYTTVQDIQKTNHLTEDVLKNGEKILIVKRVG